MRTALRLLSSSLIAWSTTLGFLFLPAITSAGPNTGASIGLHYYGSTRPVNQCSRPELNSHTVYTGAVLSFPAFVYVFVCNGAETPGIAGIEFGLQYQGGYNPDGGALPIDIFEWHLCADAETPTPSWPNPGSGNRIVWSSAHCQTHRTDGDDPSSVLGLAGYFYLSAYGNQITTLRIDRHPSTQQAKILSCAGDEDVIAPISPGGARASLGSLVFSSSGGSYGTNPCLGPNIIPIQAITWSRVKGSHWRVP